MSETAEELPEIIVTANSSDAGGGGFLSGLGFGGFDWSGILSQGPGGMSSDQTEFLLN